MGALLESWICFQGMRFVFFFYESSASNMLPKIAARWYG
jgi:hypothetical protein